LLAREYFNKENFEMAEHTQNYCLEILEKSPNTKKVIGKIAISPYFSMMQNSISKILGL